MKIKSILAAAVLGIVSLSSQAASYSFNIDYTGPDTVTSLNGSLWADSFNGGLSNVLLNGLTLGVTENVANNLYTFSLGTSNTHHVLSFDAASLFGKSMNFTTITAGGSPISVTPQANVTAVPEPETYAMLLAGLGAVGFMSRRRQRIGQS